VRRIIAGSVAVGLVAGLLAAALALGPPSTRAAQPARAAAGIHCPTNARVLPADAVARAADTARIESPRLYPGVGAAIVTQSNLAPYANARGNEVRQQCASHAFHRTVVVGLLFPQELHSASLSQGTVFVSLFATGFRVWEVAH
jgi:hypothetical protein